MNLLKEGDIFLLADGDSFYATVPRHFLYGNRKGDWSLDRGHVTIAGELSHLAGRYVVLKTTMDGGGTAHGPHDVYPDGHHVFAEHLGGQRERVDFYQSGCFTAMLPDKVAIGRATIQWVENDAAPQA